MTRRGELLPNATDTIINRVMADSRLIGSPLRRVVDYIHADGPGAKFLNLEAKKDRVEMPTRQMVNRLIAGRVLRSGSEEELVSAWAVGFAGADLAAVADGVATQLERHENRTHLVEPPPPPINHTRALVVLEMFRGELAVGLDWDQLGRDFADLAHQYGSRDGEMARAIVKRVQSRPQLWRGSAFEVDWSSPIFRNTRPDPGSRPAGLAGGDPGF